MLLILVCCVLFSACVAGNNRDLSRRAPFSAYVGRTVALLRPVYVFDERGVALTLPRYRIDSGPINTVPPDYGFSRLPAGHLVHLDSVQLKVGFDSGAIPTALGHTFVPALGQEVEFYLGWGFQGTLFRAPWEPSTVPERRETHDAALLP